MRFISALAVVAMLTTAAACGDEPVQKPGETSIPPMNSGIEKVPVPQMAKRAPEGKPGRDTLKMESYRVPDMTFEEIRAWYRVHMPVGGPWGEWLWCYDTFEGKMGVGWDYYLPGSPKLLSLGVTITRDDPPGIVITRDELGGECTAKQAVR